jgi:hypothetical protein
MACAAAKREASRNITGELERAAHELRAERHYQADLRRIEQANALAKRAARKPSSVERRSESDDEVRANIPPEWAALFERVKGLIKGDTRRSRTEAFLQYAEEHPGELLASHDDAADVEIAELERRQAELAPYARSRRYTPDELSAVPF